MKYAAIFASAGALAAAFPQAAPPAAEELKPWIEEPKPSACGTYGFSELQCGTKIFCDAHDPNYRLPEMLGGHHPKEYKSAEACFKAHKDASTAKDTPPLVLKPWLQPDSSKCERTGMECDKLCTWMKNRDIEGCVGTEVFCGNRRSSAKAYTCLAEREKAPFVAAPAAGCGDNVTSEQNCGTKAWCGLLTKKQASRHSWRLYSAMFGPKASGEKRCLAYRTAPSA